MMEEIVLTATRRNVIGKQVRALRREGKLPGVIYGHRFDPLAITLDLRDASRSLAGLAPSALVTVVVDGETHLSLVREKQRDKITGILKHLDFLAVSMKEKLRTKVFVSLVGVAPAIKTYNAIQVAGADELEVECLPQDLPERIEVDLSELSEIGSAIFIRDLNVSDKVKILTDPDTMIVLITAPELEEAAEGEVLSAEPEVIEKGKKEEEDF
jgi:large subunit ribosomal protein L25